MMFDYANVSTSGDDRPYYFTLDRQYNVRGVVDRAGALVEIYKYDEYGRLRIRECPARGDMDNDGAIYNTKAAVDRVRFDAVSTGTKWDPRADLTDDGAVEVGDSTQRTLDVANWYPASTPVVSHAFSGVGNRFGWQGRPHYAIDTTSSATDGKLMLIDHRLRMHDPVLGRWLTRDPIGYNGGTFNLYEYIRSNPLAWLDPLGLVPSFLFYHPSPPPASSESPWTVAKDIWHHVSNAPIYAHVLAYKLMHPMAIAAGSVLGDTIRGTIVLLDSGYELYPGTGPLVNPYVQAYLETLMSGEQADGATGAVDGITQAVAPNVFEPFGPSYGFVDTYNQGAVVGYIGGQAINTVLIIDGAFNIALGVEGAIKLAQVTTESGEVLTVLLDGAGAIVQVVGGAAEIEYGAGCAHMAASDGSKPPIKRRMGGKDLDSPKERPPGETWEPNPKHHPNSESPEPPNSKDLYDHSIKSKEGTRWARDADGTIHRFAVDAQGNVHWNGSTAGDRPISWQNIPRDIKDLIREGQF